MLGRLNAKNEVNGGYYTIKGIETRIEKGRLSAIGKEIDNVPPAPPAAPPPSPPAPPAAPGPSSTPSSPQADPGFSRSPVEPAPTSSSDPTVFRLGQDEEEFIRSYPTRLGVDGSPDQVERAGEYFFRDKDVDEDVIEVTYRQLAAFEEQEGIHSKKDFDPDYYIRSSNEELWATRYVFDKHLPGYVTVTDRARLKIAVAKIMDRMERQGSND